MKQIRFYLGIIGILFIFYGVIAAVPSFVNFQGSLSDGSGNPVDTTDLQMVFSIYMDPTTPTWLWTETQMVDVNKGSYNVKLGSVTNFPTGLFDNENLYLGVRVGADPEMTPRSQISSTPFAMKAGQAAKADSAKQAAKADSSKHSAKADSAKQAAKADSSKHSAKADSSKHSAKADSSKHSAKADSSGHAKKCDTCNVALSLIPSSVSSANIIDGTIQAADLGQNGASSGQVLKWNGSAWVVANDEAGSGTFLPLAGGTMTGAINSSGNPPITMGKGNFGSGNTNTGAQAFVAGLSNSATGGNSVISGGLNNIASGDWTTVSGGEENIAGGPWYSTVGGGRKNQATGVHATVGGGYNNIASGGVSSTISGGSLNTASGDFATVGGGDINLAVGQYSTISGGRANTAGAVSNQVATVGGGFGNTASGLAATVSGGEGDTASGDYATISGGDGNHADGDWSIVGGGSGNTAGGDYSMVGGGLNNSAGSETQQSATVGGGERNMASGPFATAPGGYADTASGDYSFAVGQNCVASGLNSFAAGQYARASEDGTFVWADKSGPSFSSTSPNQFLIRAEGGVGIGTESPEGALDVSSTTGAFIVPRMTTGQRNALTPINGMIIYNTQSNQFNFYENGAWVTK